MTWTIFWLILIVVAIAAELVALKTGNTPLTHVYLRLACSTFLRILMFGFFFWMLWHWLTQPYLWMDTSPYVVIDLGFVALGMFAGWKVGPPKWSDCNDEV